MLTHSPIYQSGYTTKTSKQFALSSNHQRALEQLKIAYSKLPRDPHLFDHEGDRFRRYARFELKPDAQTLKLLPHGKFYQSKTYDVLYGDFDREFAPLTPELCQNSLLQSLLVKNFDEFPHTQEERSETFEISLHMIRITADERHPMARPAPEGIHRDGYYFGAVHLMNRENLLGAENRVYDLQKRLIDRLTMTQTLDSFYFDDRRIFHGVQPFIQHNTRLPAHRDVMILLYQPMRLSPQRS